MAYAEDEGEFWIACDSCSNRYCEYLAEEPESRETCTYIVVLIVFNKCLMLSSNKSDGLHGGPECDLEFI